MKKFFATAAFGLFAVFSLIIFSETANAQRPGWANRRYTRVSVNQVINRVEDRTDRFVNQLDNSLDRSRLNGTRREDNLNQRARDLESATDELRREFDRRGDNWWETRQNVQRCLSIAADINVAMRNRRFRDNSENN